MRAEANETHGARVSALPGIELFAQEAEVLPQRARSSRAAAALDLDHRRGELDDSGIEVDGAAGGEVVRTPGAMHHRSAHDAPRRTECILRSDGHVVDDRRELRLDPDRRQPFRTGATGGARGPVAASGTLQLNVDAHLDTFSDRPETAWPFIAASVTTDRRRA
ncbi:MAG: hypothetical protein DMD35_11825 [Gemmatimonadetes bacterium]|nr:MAG: hypothetical protein DMD35_11825 [Gemmatimonadota bacterium]